MLKDPELNSGNTYSFKQPERLFPDNVLTEGTKRLGPNQSCSCLGKKQSPVQQHLGIPECSMADANPERGICWEDRLARPGLLTIALGCKI